MRLRRSQSEDRTSPGLRPSRLLLDDAVDLFRKSFDPRNGGFGPPPKFPTPHNLLFLLRYFERERDASAKTMAETTLAQMARGGIFDQIGGGFSRYSTDAVWLVPHFEKMLYDNALLSYLYLEAFRIFRRPFFRDTAVSTLAYVLRELADSDGVEGKYYAITPAEVDEVLGESDGKIFSAWFGITGSGGGIPNLLKNPGYELADARISELRQKFSAYRRVRAQLRLDDKRLTSWGML